MRGGSSTRRSSSCSSSSSAAAAAAAAPAAAAALLVASEAAAAATAGHARWDADAHLDACSVFGNRVLERTCVNARDDRARAGAVHGVL